VKRDAAGAIESISLQDTDGGVLELVPMVDPDRLPGPALVEVPSEHGARLRLRVHADGETGLLPCYTSVGDDGRDPQGGSDLMMRRTGPQCVFAVVREGGLEVRTRTEDGGERRLRLPAVRDRPGFFGDGAALVEVLPR
jgi:hypothetical protein